jgi:hypothetical protein
VPHLVHPKLYGPHSPRNCLNRSPPCGNTGPSIVPAAACRATLPPGTRCVPIRISHSQPRLRGGLYLPRASDSPLRWMRP